MNKYPNIVQALMRLEFESEKRNRKRNKMQDHPEWLQLVYFNHFEFPILHYTFYNGLYIVFEKYDTSPFVYLNLN